METLQHAIERIIGPLASKPRHDPETFYIDFHTLKLKHKREILRAYMASKPENSWGDLIEGMSNTQKIAAIMHDYLVDRKEGDIKRLLFKNKVLEMLEVGMFDALADRVQPLLDDQVKKTLQSYADCMNDDDVYLFA
jgi:hypothetical protein